MLRIGALISGGGRTVLNLAESFRRDAIPASIAVVIAHRSELAGVERCRSAGLSVEVLPRSLPSPLSPTQSLDDRIDVALADANVDLVCLCGYLRHFRVGQRWAGRTLNIHPSLLPEFGGHGMFGDHVHAAVLAAGASHSGCTVHLVDEVYDRGPILLQRRCPVLPGDDVRTLAARVYAEETLAYPEVVRRIATGELPLPIALSRSF
ncbi:MAG: phosphoribosylglycinamide formyltransferase [Phycisphaerae bacterium]|jgi:phosphoribosylglycinamide formyltransferase-1|nr:phosphoribosylglycinamide formyltransferase [Phycisphaerae bacterium]